MRALCWHVHGSYLTSLVQGSHDWLIPVTPDRGPDGLGRARTWDWPPNAVEVSPQQLREAPPDVVVLQRPHELDLVQRWTSLRPGTDLPAVYLEHNTPRGDAAGWRHPMADRGDIPVVHVTAFNAAMWDSGAAPVFLVEHGIPDPGHRWTGTRRTLAVCINEPVRRSHVTGLDITARLARQVPVEVYGMSLAGLAARIPVGLAGAHEDLPQAELHARLGEHRGYLHPHRWTSLGLSLLEAMALGVPVVVLAATAAADAVPPGAGFLSPDQDGLTTAAHRLLADRDRARQIGLAGRRHVLQRYGLNRFLDDWDAVLKEVT